MIYMHKSDSWSVTMCNHGFAQPKDDFKGARCTLSRVNAILEPDLPGFPLRDHCPTSKRGNVRQGGLTGPARRRMHHRMFGLLFDPQTLQTQL